jgi:hypothetical protein
MMLFNKIRDAILFQGNMKNSGYFEGWYYKQVSPDEKTAVCMIPGVSLADDGAHSFVQYIYIKNDENGEKSIKTGYFRYGLDEFKFYNDPFKIKIADNVFTRSSISVKLEDQNLNIAGTLEFGSLTPIRKSVLSPNIMGFFAYFPGMECYHGIVSMNHTLRGKLKINHGEIDFNDGKGYIEKDWGTSFPKKYIWIQCNNFDNNDTSIFFSAADIPFMKSSIFGFICNLVTGGKEYRFATYNRSKLNIECATDNQIALTLENGKVKLRIEADRNNIGELIAPKRGKMQEIIKEGLVGGVKIYLYNERNELIYKDISNMAGIEITT